MAKRKSLIRQTQEALEALACYGQSKRQSKAANGGKAPGIHSYSTMGNYIHAACQFARWAKETHRDRTLEAARAHVPEYLRQRIAAGKSPWTVARDAAALAKLYGTDSSSWGVELPKRERAGVTQHRNPDTIAGHFSPARNADLLALARSCGLRRHELEALRPEDIRQTEDGKTLVHVRQGKGGRSRTVEALDDTPARLAAAAAAAGRSRLLDSIPKRAPIHACRREYAQELYRRTARPPEDLPKQEQYRLRGDRAGEVLDRQAMAVVSGNLGHSRLDVVTHYL